MAAIALTQVSIAGVAVFTSEAKALVVAGRGADKWRI
jgi:hypothetical protein